MAHTTQSPPVRVIIRLPYNRPQEGAENPPRIEWNAEKESILWEVIARSRASDSGGTDWQGLAAHLGVPLPYLLFRAQTRYEEDLRGLQDLRGALGPTATQPTGKPSEEDAKAQDRPEPIRRISGRTMENARQSYAHMNSPLGVRTRLNSLGYDSGPRHSKTSSSSILTLQGARNMNLPSPIKSSSFSPSQSESDSDGADETEEAEQRLEEQEALDAKLKRLQTVMTSDALGLVRSARFQVKGKQPQRGRDIKPSISPSSSPSRQTFRQRDLSSSDFNSSSSSPQGSIPSIPSPPPEPQIQSPMTRHMPHAKKSSSPPALSSGQARGQAHMQYRPMAVGMAHTSDRGSNQGSSTSSFSDISESTSLSASALESALLSNIRGTGSRFSAFARSQFGRRTSGAPHQ
ncbi:hypothetical protein DFH11DRAFT_672136 [Phellopilus nigrolimitatus]|nr:hypothetical protein DFH11DRAFT_672136 [Phellopilus nigrolimitatus]